MRRRPMLAGATRAIPRPAFGRGMRLARVLAASLLLAASSCAARPAETADTPVPRDFFGLHVNNAAPRELLNWPQTPFPDLGQRAMRLQNAHTEWRHLNPAPGVFDWRVLDARVAQDAGHGVTTMLVLGGPPDWVKRPWLGSDAPDRGKRFLYAHWAAYVGAVVRRYGNRIAYYELWNEPDIGGFDSGRLEEMIELARIARPIVKRHAPRSRLLSPAFSLPERRILAFERKTYPVTLESFLGAGGGRLVDAISIHAYPGDGNTPESLTPRLHYARSIVDAAGLRRMPMIDSESGARGWRDANGKIHNIPPTFGEPLPTTPVDLQSAYVSRTLLAIAASGTVRQSYYFTYDNGDNAPGNRSVMAVVMTGAAPAGRMRRPALAYRYLAGLLPGGRIGPLSRVGGHWEVAIRTAGGQPVRAYWCDDYRTDRITLPAGAQVRDVTGAAMQRNNDAMTIDASPIFVLRESKVPGEHR